MKDQESSQDEELIRIIASINAMTCNATCAMKAWVKAVETFKTNILAFKDAIAHIHWGKIEDK